MHDQSTKVDEIKDMERRRNERLCEVEGNKGELKTNVVV
jgi:hypothetical protein